MATRASRPFWLRPKWVVGHVLVAALVVVAVSLGFWQLDRLDQRRTRNAEVVARIEQPPAPVQELVDPADGVEVGEDVRYRRAVATGTYDRDEEVLIRSRSLDGATGYWIVTPLVLDDGSAIAVNRGFLPYTGDLERLFAAGPPPEGRVTVEGILFASEEREGIGPTDPAEGRLDTLARLDVARIEQQVDADLYPVSLQRTAAPDDEPGALPVTLDPPALDEGPHLSYAGQWFLFALIGAIGWPILLWRTGREERGGGRSVAPPPPVRRPEPDRAPTPG